MIKEIKMMTVSVLKGIMMRMVKLKIVKNVQRKLLTAQNVWLVDYVTLVQGI